eukprot:Skav225737  [mRNA]  locus=scaffold28:12852:14931:- [translate_table: standard]
MWTSFGMLVLTLARAAEWDVTGMLQMQNVQAASGRIAILMAGTLDRFHLGSTAEHLVAPLHAAGWQVDYFASVFAGSTHTWDSGAQERFEKDPLFAKIQKDSKSPDNFAIRTIISDTLKRFGARIPFMKVFDRHDVAPADESYIQGHGTAMWKNLKRQEIARQNFILMLKELETMWHMLKEEEKTQLQPYSYVMILRDDAWWMEDFNLDLLLRNGKQRGRGRGSGSHFGHLYSLFCKNLPTKGIIDHVFVLDRTAAEMLGTSYSRIIRPADFGTGWLQQMKSQQPKNSENFFMMLSNFTGLGVTEVPETLLPMQRAGRVNGSICLHKFCERQGAPVPLLKCTDLTHSTT